MSEAPQKEYWKPSVTADIVAVNSHLAKFRDDGTFMNLVLIKRSEKSEAFPDTWALPGGFLDKGETVEQCAVRELREETGLEARMLAPIEVFSRPDRDPRGQVISHAFFTMLISSDNQPLYIKEGDDAKEIALFNLKGHCDVEKGELEVSLRCVENGARIAFKATFTRGWMGLIQTHIEYDERKSNTTLAFDHAEIVARAILRMPGLVNPTPDMFGRSRVEHAEAPDNCSDAELKKRIQIP